MRTILGAGGQIAIEAARALGGGIGGVRLVSRNPARVNDADELVRADLLDAEQTKRAVAGSSVVYFTAGLPANTELWEERFPVMLRNALDAARATGARFVFFDNTYMYPQDDRLLTEDAAFAPVGRKGAVRARMAEAVLEEMARGDIPVLVARAPEFYGPGRTQGFTNALVLDRMLAGDRPLVPVSADRKRSLIWTPDASRALVLLGETEDAYRRTWHLPIDTARPTYRQLIALAAEGFGTPDRFTVLPSWLLRAAGLVSPRAREIGELLPRYAQDNLFDASAFSARFPDFRVTTFREGLAAIRQERTAREGGAER